MELTEHVDAEEWHKILDRFFHILTDGVHRFEGTVNQYTGDGIMALFGAPIAREDHAQRACYAVLHLSAGPLARRFGRFPSLSVALWGRSFIRVDTAVISAGKSPAPSRGQ